MKKIATFLALSLALGMQAQQFTMTVDASKPTARIQPEMYGIFFGATNLLRLGAVRQCDRTGCGALF